MGVHEPWHDQVPGKIEDLIRSTGQFVPLPDRFDPAIPGEKTARSNLTAGSIHGDQPASILDQERGHGSLFLQLGRV